ncbi:DUF6922 domain-containing protein [Leeuwenhoekiella polynyae]|uniref:DUF6922 domain-containing protein n=1 Tax=Leeuwenhoekiella polynyae TaxID=1550906 RepID=A0A4Q0PEQ9_9FLAO|nr:hypothetical protein [Leeuwenhoekiella polynyae]RXG25324.1 hypothetical protein DSM02_1294 [Leeuwenhoekiella polynyae]
MTRKKFTSKFKTKVVLQSSYDVQQALELKPMQTPNLKHFRKVLFWDTKLDKIDWYRNKRAVIKRVLERGNQLEIEELIKFYGKQTISKIVQSIKTSHLPSFEENIKRYNLII